jgi:CubicO group peptidase (beta-lactamase class C family)
VGPGLLLNEAQQPGMQAAGSSAWAGLFSIHFWIDPTSRVTGSIFSQTLPFADSAAFELYADFEHALYPRCRHRQLAPPCGAQE